MSTPTKHTPGPWYVDRREILSGEGRFLRGLAEVFSGAADSLEQADANCRLIAAAPDLLNALRDLLHTTGVTSEHYSAAIRAVAKAEGRS